MKKINIYMYLGSNGTITSPVLLEGVQHATYYKLEADEGKILTNGKNEQLTVIIPVEDLDKWKEIDDGQ